MFKDGLLAILKIEKSHLKTLKNVAKGILISESDFQFCFAISKHQKFVF